MKPNSIFNSGDRVVHEKFGPGVVVSEWGYWDDTDDKGRKHGIDGRGIFDVQFDGQAKPRAVHQSTLRKPVASSH